MEATRTPDLQKQRQLDEVLALERRGLIAEATMLLDDLLAVDPDDYYLLRQKAEFDVSYDAPSQAVRAAANFSFRFPHDVRGALLLASADLRAKHPLSAIERLDALELDHGRSPESCRLRFEALTALGRIDEARRIDVTPAPTPPSPGADLEAAFRNDPANSEATNALTEVYIAEGRPFKVMAIRFIHGLSKLRKSGV